METYIGRQLGNYRIEKRLARGGFGEVYLARHTLLPRQAAIKFLHAQFCSSEEQHHEFLQEARLLESLKHAHILPLYDVGIEQEDFPPYLIAAYAPGGSLRERIRQQQDGCALEEALRILEQIGQALQHAHEQPQPVIHRDLKPENILFDGADQALLADFGIAVVLNSDARQRVGTAGTLPYMAPEQFEGQASSKSDQYALGCLAYELITGRKPLQAQNQEFVGWLFQHARTLPQAPSLWRPGLPLHIELAILKALAKDPDERHSDVESFLYALHTAPHNPAHYQALLAAWLHTAQEEQTQQRYEQALARYAYTARIDPSDTRPLKGQAEVLLALRRPQEALATYEQILRRAPDDAATLESIARLRQPAPVKIVPSGPPPAQVTALHSKAEGDAQAQQRHYPEACQAYEQALLADPHVELDWYLFGETCRNLGRYGQAHAAYQRVLQHNPQHAAAWSGLADALHHLGRNDAALAACTQAIHHAPDDAAAYYTQGTILAEEGHASQALTAYEQALRLQPDFVLAHCARGDIHYNKRAYRAALVAYEQALHYESACISALYGRADTLLKLKREEEARAAYTLALRHDTTTSSLRRADALFLLARYPEALALYQHLLKTDPANPDLHERCGDIYHQLGQEQEAHAAYQRADQLRGYV